MHSSRTTRGKIMRRVYAIFVLRTLAQPAVKLAVMGAAVLAVVSAVSVSNVAANAFSAFTGGNVFPYLLDAFVTTETAVQALTLIILAVGLWSLKDLVSLLTARRFALSV